MRKLVQIHWQFYMKEKWIKRKKKTQFRYEFMQKKQQQKQKIAVDFEQIIFLIVGKSIHSDVIACNWAQCRWQRPTI